MKQIQQNQIIIQALRKQLTESLDKFNSLNNNVNDKSDQLEYLTNENRLILNDNRELERSIKNIDSDHTTLLNDFKNLSNTADN